MMNGAAESCFWQKMAFGLIVTGIVSHQVPAAAEGLGIPVPDVGQIVYASKRATNWQVSVYGILLVQRGRNTILRDAADPKKYIKVDLGMLEDAGRREIKSGCAMGECTEIVMGSISDGVIKVTQLIPFHSQNTPAAPAMSPDPSKTRSVGPKWHCNGVRCA